MHPFVGIAWRTAHEVVDHIRMVEKEGDGVDEENRPDHGSYGRVVKEMSGDNGTVGLADKYKSVPLVLLQYLEDFVAHGVLRESGMGYAEADGEDFDGYEADLTVFGGVWVVRCGDKFFHEPDVGI